MSNTTISILIMSIAATLVVVSRLRDFLMRKHREYHGIEEPEECCCQRRERERRQREMLEERERIANEITEDTNRFHSDYHL